MLERRSLWPKGASRRGQGCCAPTACVVLNVQGDWLRSAQKRVMPLVYDSVSDFSLRRRAGWAIVQAAVRRANALRGGHGVSGWCRQRRRPHRVNRTLHEEVSVGSPVEMISIGEPEVARALGPGGGGTIVVVGAPSVGGGRGQHRRGADGLWRIDTAQGLRRPGTDVSAQIASPSVVRRVIANCPNVAGGCFTLGRWQDGAAVQATLPNAAGMPEFPSWSPCGSLQRIRCRFSPLRQNRASPRLI